MHMEGREPHGSTHNMLGQHELAAAGIDDLPGTTKASSVSLSVRCEPSKHVRPGTRQPASLRSHAEATKRTEVPASSV